MSRLQHHPPADRDSPSGRLQDAALQSYEDLTVTKISALSRTSTKWPPQSAKSRTLHASISSMQAEDVSDYVVPLFLREREHRHPCVRGGESYQ